MHTELKQRLEELLEVAKTYRFSKKEYETTFNAAYATYRDLFDALAAACEESEEAITELAAVLPAVLKKELETLTSKRKREGVQMDYNTTVVTYVIPLLDYNKDPNLDKLIDAFIEQWNASGTGTMLIGRASFTDIQKGFKFHLCYITTAVCENLQAEDDCYELNLLRNYRDHYLLSEESGEELVTRYYDIAPTIVKRIERQDNAKSVYKRIWNTYLRPCVTYIENNENEACKTLYTKMVKELQHTYITRQ